MATNDRADQNPEQDRTAELEEWYADDDPGEELYQPAIFDLEEFEARKRQRLDLLVIATFAFAALFALFMGALITATSAQTKLLLGILTIVASVTLQIIRLNRSSP